MEVNITGTNKKMSRKEVEYILSFFSDILLGKRLSKHIFIDILYESMSYNYCGYCMPTDYDYRKHREFEITINNRMSRDMQIRTLAHEMVHLMQFARNKFKILDDNEFRWNGRVMKISYENYFSMPWEKEAHLSEDYLIDFYKNHCKIHKVKFK